MTWPQRLTVAAVWVVRGICYALQPLGFVLAMLDNDHGRPPPKKENR